MDITPKQFNTLLIELKKIREHLEQLRNSVTAIHDDNEVERDRNQAPLPVVVSAELQMPERVQADQGRRDDRTHRQQVWQTCGTWLTFIATAAAFLAASYYAHWARLTYKEIALQTPKISESADAARDTAAFTRQQVIGTSAAIVAFQGPSLDESNSNLSFGVANGGHVISPLVHLEVELLRTSMDGKEQLAKPQAYTYDIPQLQPNNIATQWFKAYRIRPALFPDFLMQFNTLPGRGTLTIKARLTYDNGFGGTFTQSLCQSYIGHVSLPSRGMAYGPGFYDCSEFYKDIEFIRNNEY